MDLPDPVEREFREHVENRLSTVALVAPEVVQVEQYAAVGTLGDLELRSIRIDQSWRGIVLAPETGDTYTLLTVRHHDDAYA